MNRAERRRQGKSSGQRQPVYQYTLAQVDEIRRRAVLEKRDELKAEIAREVEKEWARRAEVVSGATEEEGMLKVLCLLMAVPTKVLCERFRWKPVDEGSDSRSALKRFSEAVVDEVNRICSNDAVDIRAYGDEVLEKYGVGYEVR